MSLGRLRVTFSSHGNTSVVVKDSRGSPARLYWDKAGTGLISDYGQTRTLANGTLDVWVSDSTSYTVELVSNGVVLERVHNLDVDSGSSPAPVLGGENLQRSNFFASNLKRAVSRMAAVRAGTASMTVDFVGDSLTFDSAGLRTNSWAHRFADVLNARDSNLRASTDAFAGMSNHTTAAQVMASDPRMNLGTGWGVTAQFSFGGNILLNSTTTNAFEFQPGVAWDTVEIEYICNSSFGVFTVGTGATVFATVDSRLTPFTLQKNTYATGTAASTNPLTIARNGTGGAVYILSVRLSNSQSRRVLVCNAGSSSSNSTGWSNNGSISYYGPLSRITRRASDLMVLALGVNDWNPPITTLATYKSQMTTIINAQRAAGGDVVLIGQPQSNPATFSSAEVQGTYLKVQRDLSDELSIPYLNVQHRWGSFAEANSRGLMQDDRHTSAVGAWDWGGMLATEILAL